MVVIAFFRHGKAEPKGEGVSDEERKLTSEGRRDVEAVARLFPFKPSIIFTSPLRRAVETAEIVARALGLSGNAILVDERLRPGSPHGVEVLESMGLRGYEVLVGHNPWLLETVEELVGGRIALPPGGAALVDVEAFKPGGGVLLALIIPQAARNCMVRNSS